MTDLAALILRELASGERERAPVRGIGVRRRILEPEIRQRDDAGAEQRERRR